MQMSQPERAKEPVTKLRFRQKCTSYSKEHKLSYQKLRISVIGSGLCPENRTFVSGLQSYNFRCQMLQKNLKKLLLP